MQIVSKADFSREAGVTPGAISKAINASLKDALTGGGINSDHPAAIRYLARCGPVGRPHGSDKYKLSDFVTSRYRELEGLGRLLPATTAPVVKNVADNLFYLGFTSGRLGAHDRNDRMVFVDSTLNQLRDAIPT
jgi:hypothetical protein